MAPLIPEIRLNVRSGLVSGLLEAISILIFAPLITRATTKVYNAITTRRVFNGSPVRIQDNSLSVEDIIPRIIRVFRTASAGKRYFSGNTETRFASVTRQFIPLLISLIMSIGIVLTSTFIDGATEPVFMPTQMFLWNGGMFVDTTSAGVNRAADDIRGMAGVRRACIERESTDTYNLFAAAFFKEQDFKTGRAANESVCVNGRDTKQKIGVTIKTDRIYNPISTEHLTVEEMEGAPANFTFLEEINREGNPDYCRVRVSANDSSTVWTFGTEKDAEDGSRFAARAVVKENGSITLQAGVAYRNLDAPETWDGIKPKPCKRLATKLFAPNRFTATISPMGFEQDPRQLELVVVDLLQRVAFSGYGRLESQEVMLRAYYAGAENVDEESGQSFGTFVPRQIETLHGEKQITTISSVAVSGLVLTLIGCLILFSVMVFLRPKVRLTSVSYISQLYSRRDVEDQIQGGMLGEVEYIGAGKSFDGSLYASPLQLRKDLIS